MSKVILNRMIGVEGTLYTHMTKTHDTDLVPVVGNDVDDLAWHHPVKITGVVCNMTASTYHVELEDLVLESSEKVDRHIEMMGHHDWAKA